MSIANDVPTVTVEELDAEQGRELFERAAQSHLGVTADEFLTWFDKGEYPEGWPAEAIQRVEFLIPFIR